MASIFVQGDRDAKGIEAQVQELGALCKERQIGLNVGESGKIVRILSESGARVVVYRSKDDEPNADMGPNVSVVDCVTPAAMATEHLLHRGAFQVKAKRVGWGVRLAVLEQTSEGFVFFPGREGTLAHLFAIAAFIAKGERDAGHTITRRIALVGWESEQSSLVLNLFRHQHPTPFAGGLGYEIPDTSFFGLFSIGQVSEALDWVAKGFPHEGC